MHKFTLDWLKKKDSFGCNDVKFSTTFAKSTESKIRKTNMNTKESKIPQLKDFLKIHWDTYHNACTVIWSMILLVGMKRIIKRKNYTQITQDSGCTKSLWCIKGSWFQKYCQYGYLFSADRITNYNKNVIFTRIESNNILG